MKNRFSNIQVRSFYGRFRSPKDVGEYLIETITVIKYRVTRQSIPEPIVLGDILRLNPKAFRVNEFILNINKKLIHE